MQEKKEVTRRDFMESSVKTAAGVAVAAYAIQPHTVLGANDRVNVAVVGINSRGRAHMNSYSNLDNVQVTHLVDPDTRLFPERVKQMEEKQGKAPKTETDIRRMLEDKKVDAVSIAACDHWHALATIWALQAGKHVNVEKPASHNIREGRKMIEAARKYGKVCACNMQNRSFSAVQKAMEYLHSGELGEVYMAKGLCFKPRDSIGRKPDGPIPEGLNFDLWLGPAQWRPYNPNYVHYNWHWFWDFGCTDLGNQGPHQMDIARWGMNKKVHPRRIKCAGGYFAFDSDQQTPNTQMATFEYDDGKIIQFEVRGLYTNAENDIKIGNLFFGSKGWMHLDGKTWKTYFGRKNEPGPSFSGKGEAADPTNLAGGGGDDHFGNFIEAVRANDWTKVNADIVEGHYSTSMCHLANLSYRLGRELTFDSHAEQFVGDAQANAYLTREYRHPFVVPEKV